jgi:hypothetical protein
VTPLYFKSGAWNAICDVCGHKYKSTDMLKRWDGLMVCKEDWEPDHPQKYLRVRQDKISTDWVRARGEDLDVSPVCTFWTSSPLADFGTADCATVGGNTSVELLIQTYYPSTSSVALIAIAGYSISGVV